MKEFIVGFIVGGYLMDKFYPRLSNFCGYKSILTPAGYYSRLFNNLKWEREEYVENAIKELKNYAEAYKYVTIAQMADLFKVKDPYIKTNYNTFGVHEPNAEYSDYAHHYGLTYNDICKLKPLKSVTKGGYHLDFNDGFLTFYDHFACVKSYYDKFEGAYAEPNDEEFNKDPNEV